MSGSPVYAADGRLLGAIAFGWSFTKDPICGITPIEEMTELWELEHEIPSWDFGAGPRTAAPPQDESSQLPRLRTPLAVSGLDPAALEYLKPWIDQFGFLLTPGGARLEETESGTLSGGPTEERLTPGEAVAVLLLRGDATLSAIGTLTAVDGDQVLAFGHPFLYSGFSSLPLSRAEIVGIVPRSQSSFKLGVPSRPIGIINEDRRAGVAGRVGEPPPMLPLEVRVSVPGKERQTFRYEIARHRLLAPALATVAAASAVISRGALPPQSAWHWRLTVQYRQGGEETRTLEMSDFASGTMVTPLLAAVGEPLTALINNPWNEVRVEDVVVEMDLTERIEAASVTAVRLDRAVTRPGETINIEIDLQTYRGPLETVRMRYRVPDHLPKGTLSLYVGGGADLARLDKQRQPGRYQPTTLENLVSQLEERPATSRLYVTAYSAQHELTVRGEEYPELPGSAQIVLAPRTHADATTSWARSTRLQDVTRDFDRAILGGTLLRVEVSPDAQGAGDS
jgi:hypothetical protein